MTVETWSTDKKCLRTAMFTMMVRCASTEPAAMFYVVLLSLLASCHSSRDPNYYISGGGQNSMFWRDASDVLVDLKSFSKLYVTFHNCA
jgi:hypothetical protein